MAHRLFATFLENFTSSGEVNCSLCVLRTLSQSLFNLFTRWCEAETTVLECLINLDCACWSPVHQQMTVTLTLPCRVTFPQKAGSKH